MSRCRCNHSLRNHVPECRVCALRAAESLSGHVCEEFRPFRITTTTTPWACVVWHGRDLLASATYYASREAAIAAAPEGQPASVVNIAHPPDRILPSTTELVRRTRPMEEHPYPYRHMTHADRHGLWPPAPRATNGHATSTLPDGNGLSGMAVTPAPCSGANGKSPAERKPPCPVSKTQPRRRVLALMSAPTRAITR
jgi:hypothetical protein